MNVYRRLRFLFAFLPIIALPALSASQEKPSDPLPSAGRPVQLDQSWNIPDFSGMQLLMGGSRGLAMRILKSGTSVRLETTPALATLYVPSTNQVYKLTVYSDKTRECIVMSSEQAQMLPSPLELLIGTKVKRTPAGTEKLEEHSCKIENFEVTRADGEIIESKVWEAEDLKGVPVKIESQTRDGKFLALYGDVELGSPDKALFTPPDKCIPYEKRYQVAEKITAK